MKAARLAVIAFGVSQALGWSGVWPSRTASAQAAPAAPPAEEFSVVLLPDTQFYALRYPSTFKAQTRWIAKSRAALGIAAVVHLGDITHRNTAREWRVADHAFRLLDGVVPYSVLPGNHDGLSHGRTDTRHFNHYFGPRRFDSRPWYGGHLGDTNDNNYILFEAKGMKFMVVSLAYGTPKSALAWANKVVAEHPQRRVIVATHAYMDRDHTRLVRGDRYAVQQDAWTDGDEIWNRLVKRHENIFLVVSGHIHGGGYATAEGVHGNPVHQVLADLQSLERGGSGYLTVLTFSPYDDEIRVRTYSPTLDKELRDPDHAFELGYEMNPAPQPNLASAGERTSD